MKPEAKASEKLVINNEYESDDDSYSKGILRVWQKKFIMPQKQHVNMIIVTTSNIKHHRNAQKQKHRLI